MSVESWEMVETSESSISMGRFLIPCLRGILGRLSRVKVVLLLFFDLLFVNMVESDLDDGDGDEDVFGLFVGVFCVVSFGVMSFDVGGFLWSFGVVEDEIVVVWFVCFVFVSWVDVLLLLVFLIFWSDRFFVLCIFSFCFFSFRLFSLLMSLKICSNGLRSSSLVLRGVGGVEKVKSFFEYLVGVD